MKFYTEGRKYKNVSIASQDGKKVIAKFKDNQFETEDNSLISLLSNKDKYSFINTSNDKIKDKEKIKILERELKKLKKIDKDELRKELKSK